MTPPSIATTAEAMTAGFAYLEAAPSLDPTVFRSAILDYAGHGRSGFGLTGHQRLLRREDPSAAGPGLSGLG